MISERFVLWVMEYTVAPALTESGKRRQQVIRDFDEDRSFRKGSILLDLLEEEEAEWTGWGDGGVPASLENAIEELKEFLGSDRVQIRYDQKGRALPEETV